MRIRFASVAPVFTCTKPEAGLVRNTPLCANGGRTAREYDGSKLSISASAVLVVVFSVVG